MAVSGRRSIRRVRQLCEEGVVCEGLVGATRLKPGRIAQAGHHFELLRLREGRALPQRLVEGPLPLLLMAPSQLRQLLALQGALRVKKEDKIGKK